jgi:hypothetical protein
VDSSRERVYDLSAVRQENPNWTILGVEREFAPIERLEDTAKGIWSSFLGEKHALDCPISIVKQNFSIRCNLRRLRGTLKIAFQLELLSARASPQLREPDNLRIFVSSPPNPHISQALQVEASGVLALLSP